MGPFTNIDNYAEYDSYETEWRHLETPTDYHNFEDVSFRNINNSANNHNCEKPLLIIAMTTNDVTQEQQIIGWSERVNDVTEER